MPPMTCCDPLAAECPLDLTEDDCRTLIRLLRHASHPRPAATVAEARTVESDPEYHPTTFHKTCRVVRRRIIVRAVSNVGPSYAAQKEEPIVRGLSAGGRWIRTFSTAARKLGISEASQT